MNEPEIAEEIRAWMRDVMAKTGLSAAAWAKAAGLAATTVQRPLRDDYEHLTSSKTLAKLAAAASMAPPNIRGLAAVPTMQFLPVRHRVQAGQWYEVDDVAQDFVAEPQPVMAQPKYGHAAQWLELVEGDSVNERIPPGAFAHVVDAIDMGYEPKRGDLVVVERRRAGGLLKERTIKEIEIAAGGKIELWPRSTNPRWKSAIVLDDGIGADEDVEVEIVGLVIGHYASRS